MGPRSVTSVGARACDPGRIILITEETCAGVGRSDPRNVVMFVARPAATAAACAGGRLNGGPCSAAVNAVARPDEMAAALVATAPAYPTVADDGCHTDSPAGPVKMVRMHKPPFTLASQERLKVQPFFGGFPSARTL